MRIFLTLFVFSISSLSIAQTDSSLPVPGFAVARDFSGAVLMPNPGVVHQVLFDAVTGAENREIAVVIHQGATPIILQNNEFKARNGGIDNPNIELIRA